ncbi:MAG: HAD hydrolase-like protein, partial [Akkermansiaceae bacterium]|nr:HAD hydrolase-like protein [Armatimonadota bacterium]
AKAGGTIRQSYYCTHHKDANSTHRKPEPGMILEAARDHDLDLSRSVFVGDTETDAQAARAAGVGTFILVLSGKFAGRPDAATDRGRFPVPPDHVCADLSEAVTWIETHQSF